MVGEKHLLASRELQPKAPANCFVSATTEARMSTTTPTQQDRPAALRNSAYERAFARAVAAKLVAYKNADGSYNVPSVSEAGVEHVVRWFGSQWFECSCDCRGAGHLACQHRAVAIKARQVGAHAVRPEVIAARAAAVTEAERIVACPGFLKVHAPAPGSNVETFCCSHCDPDAR